VHKSSPFMDHEDHASYRNMSVSRAALAMD
jgi:hypothetical protein